MASTSRLRNVFREGFEYRITPEGASRLAAGSGASPAFLAILAIASAGPVSFRVIAEGMSHIGPDDLELWLSAMCDMGLLENAQAPAFVPAEDVAGAAPSAGECQTDAVEATRPDLPVVLLVHKDARARANWRRALGGQGFALMECARLEAVEDALREHRPEWVVLGLEGEDFEGLHLLRALKRPRARQVARVCLVVPRGHAFDQSDAATAERADARAASVTDIVRAVCGEGALDEVAAEPGHEATTDATLPADVTASPIPASAPEVAPVPASSEPVWMNLLYGAATPYGGAHLSDASLLEAHYPRLVLRMIEGWHKPGFAREINDLILDDRGDRHGFPPEVMEELWCLQRLHQDWTDLEADPAGPRMALRLASQSHA
jgi:ActR/RegA family two-component response regulator